MLNGLYGCTCASLHSLRFLGGRHAAWAETQVVGMLLPETTAAQGERENA